MHPNNTDCTGAVTLNGTLPSGGCHGGQGPFKSTSKVETFCPDDLPPRPLPVVDVDLRRLVSRLARDHAADFPTASDAEAALAEYVRFLTLQRVAPSGELAPSAKVDHVWHAHIIDTRAYAADCERIFGGFLHHAPSFDADATEQVAMRERYATTLRRYTAAFGEPPADVWPRSAVAAGSQCYIPNCCA